MSDAVTSPPDGPEPCPRRYVESGLADQVAEFVASLVTASRLGPTGRPMETHSTR
jgi:hypothetical protein